MELILGFAADVAIRMRGAAVLERVRGKTGRILLRGPSRRVDVNAMNTAPWGAHDSEKMDFSEPDTPKPSVWRSVSPARIRRCPPVARRISKAHPEDGRRRFLSAVRICDLLSSLRPAAFASLPAHIGSSAAAGVQLVGLVCHGIFPSWPIRRPNVEEAHIRPSSSLASSACRR